MMISEKMVFTSSNGNHLVLYARPPAGISIQKCSVRSSFLLKDKKTGGSRLRSSITAYVLLLHPGSPGPLLQLFFCGTYGLADFFDHVVNQRLFLLLCEVILRQSGVVAP